MDYHVKEFFSRLPHDAPMGNFHEVMILHERRDLDWSELVKKSPKMCRGWFELARLDVADRIEFTRDFWLSQFPYHPKLEEFINRFFSSLDDVCVFLTQQKYDDPFEAHMIYSLSGDAGFFRGALPAHEEDLIKLQGLLASHVLPDDYRAFLLIHNGFWKTTDCTGVLSTAEMCRCYQNFQQMIEETGGVTTAKGEPVNPNTLIPFYESFGMPFFQCFWSEWYPEHEMGNVYYSGLTKSISATDDRDRSGDSMSFVTFLDWLMFYMERIG